MILDLSVQQHLMPVAIFLVMLSIGMELELSQFRGLLREPRVPVLGTLIHTFTFPAVAIALTLGSSLVGIELSEPLVIGIFLIAACPSGGFSNVLVLIARADLALSVTLTSVSSVLSFLTVPFLFWLFSGLTPFLSGSVELPVAQTLLQLFLLILLPVVLGMIWRHLRKAFVAKYLTIVQRYVKVLLFLAIFAVVVEQWDVMRGGMLEAVQWSIALCVATLALGYGLSSLLGLDATESATVAIEGSIRNLAVAFVIAANVLGRVDAAVLPSVYVIPVLISTFFFARVWRRCSGVTEAVEG